MIKIAPNIMLHLSEVEFTYIRAAGPGGQNVNKVATAVQLRFNVNHSSLPPEIRERVFMIFNNKITAEGDLIIKAYRHRTQERNKQDALQRLVNFLKRAAFPPKKRKKTRPTFASTQKRLMQKKLHSKKKNIRRNQALLKF